MRTILLTMHSTMSGIIGEMETSGENSSAMGQAFDTSKNDDSFYLPPQVLDNEDFKRATPDSRPRSSARWAVPARS
ncbi:MAG TPA: hypothetical protein VME67_22930 [Mycobacterium sp.]|nr:hypothetical protein [Mycobacterium sp.]HTX97431.1 hypothetical protein [Mycobacterium sp.]